MCFDRSLPRSSSLVYKKKIMTRSLILLALVLLISCSPQIKVYSDMDPDNDLWTYKSFDWGRQVDIETGRNPLQYNELNDKRIKAAALSQLQSRGYVLRNVEPDLILHYHIIVDDKSVVVPETFGYRYGSYWTKSGANVFHYREGTLIIDLMERNTKNLVWRGWAVANIDEIDPEEIDEVIRLAVEKIFKRFPPKPESASKKNTSN
jgi:hypothetical protein